MLRPKKTRQECARKPNTLGQGRECDTDELSALLEAHGKLFENQGAGAAVLDLEGNCLVCNPALERMLGNGVTEGACAIRSEDLRYLHFRLVETNLWKRIRKSGRVTNQELELPGTNGRKIHVLANAAVLETGPDGSHFVFLSMVDVGRLKKTERNLQRTIDRVSSLVKSLEEDVRAKEKDLETLGRDLEQAHRSLKKVNDATGILNARIREQTQHYQNRIVHDFNLTVRPLMEHLKSLHPVGPETHLLEAMDFNMRHIASQFGVNLSKRQVRLSPREIEICAMIRAGKDSRQMARSLGIAYETVIVHRKNIRKKLGLKRKKQNLATYIMENM